MADKKRVRFRIKPGTDPKDIKKQIQDAAEKLKE